MATKTKSAPQKFLPEHPFDPVPNPAKSAQPKSKAARHVYNFGDGKADGDGSMKPLLGGKGANLAEMTRIGLPVPPGFHDHDRSLHLLLRAPEELSAHAPGRNGKRHREHGADHGHEVRRHREDAAARRGSFRGARFHAGNDGHDPESRPERPDRGSAGQGDRTTSGSPGIATGVSSRCTATS